MPPASFSHRSDPQRTDRYSRASEVLEGVFRSPGLILRANGSTKCGRHLLRSSLAAALLSGLLIILHGWVPLVLNVLVIETLL